MTANLVRRGFNVVITYPLGDDDYAYLVEHVAALGTRIHAFTLGPSLAVALSDRGERRLSAQDGRGPGEGAIPYLRAKLIKTAITPIVLKRLCSVIVASVDFVFS